MAFFSCLPAAFESPALQESLAFVVLLVALSRAPASLAPALPSSGVLATSSLSWSSRHRIESNVAAATQPGGNVVLVVVEPTSVLVVVIVVTVDVVVTPAMAGYAAPNASAIAALLKCFIVYTSDAADERSSVDLGGR